MYLYRWFLREFRLMPSSASLVLAENTKATVTLGELLTQGDPLKSTAPDYTHPVFVVTGDKDLCVTLPYRPLYLKY